MVVLNNEQFFFASESRKKPTREQIINVHANFCNLRDADDIPIFECMIASLLVNGNEGKARDWFTRLEQAGSTHITINLSGDYNENLGWISRYPITGIDFTNRLSDFSSILDRIEQEGFIPFIKLAFDGQSYDPNGLTYGWQWGMDNIDRIANGLSKHIELALFSTGYDGCYAVWSPDQLIQMLRKMRSVLGNKACIDTETNGPGFVSYCHLGNGAADWHNNQLDIVDHFSLEMAPIYPNIQMDAIAEAATRLLGPAAKNCPQTPYYLEGLDKTIAIDFFETVAYQAIRKQVSPDNARSFADAGAYYGFSVFGNGLPH